MKYQTKLPANFEQLSKKHQDWYQKKQKYSLSILQSKKLNNVFITNSGLLIHHLLLPIKSAENLIGTYDYTFYYKYWRKAIEQFLVSKYGKSLNSIKYNNKNIEYYTIQTPWFGYFSWLTTHLPRLINIQQKNPNAVLLLPLELEEINYVRNSISCVQNLKLELVPKNHHIFVKNYIFQQVRPWTSKFFPEDIFAVRSFFDVKENKKANKRIYISRSKAKRRKIINESEFETYLLAQNFEIVHFEDLSISQQVNLMSETEIVISLHGAGLTNCMFMQPQSNLIELIPEVEKLKDFRFPFWRISSIVGLRYYSLFCETKSTEEIDLYDRNIIVSIKEIHNILEQIK
jgi:hypothetical protein